MNDHQVLAVWGSPESGKTTTAIKIAKELESMKYSVVLVSCDDSLPMLPILTPQGKQTHPSLGELLSLSRISQPEILKHCVPYGNMGNISLLGYRMDDNEKTYPEYSPNMAQNILIALTRLADKIVVDCSSRLMGNVFTTVALQSADAVLRIVNANLRSSMFLRSQQLMLTDASYHYDSHTIVLNNVKPNQDAAVYSEILGGASYVLPHIPTLEEQYETGKLMGSLFGREAKQYEPVIKAIVHEVFEK